MSRRDYAGGAQPTTSTRLFTAADQTLSVVALVGWPDGVQGPFAVSIDRETEFEEKVLCDTINGNDLHVIQRGYDGTTPRDHSAGASVEHVFTAIDAEEANAHINTATGVHGIPVGAAVVGTSGQQTLTDKTIDLSPGSGNIVTNLPLSSSPDFQASITSLENADAAEATARAQAVTQEAAARTAADNAESLARANADTAHAQAADPHPQYLTQPEGDARYRLIGEVTMFAGAAIPAGWLVCDGSAISSVTYPELVAVLGSTNLPDLRGRVPRGAGSGFALGATGGADAHAIGAANLPQHAHTINHDHGSVDSSGPYVGAAANRIAPSVTGTASGGSAENGGLSLVQGGTGGRFTHQVTASHTHHVDLPTFAGSSGGGPGTSDPLDTKDPFSVLNFIIRAL